MPQMTFNIPSSVFCGSVLSEFLRIAKCTLLFEDFIPKAVEPFQRMLAQGGVWHLVVKQIQNTYQRYPEAFQNLQVSPNEIIKRITAGQ